MVLIEESLAVYSFATVDSFFFKNFRHEQHWRHSIVGSALP